MVIFQLKPIEGFLGFVKVYAMRVNLSVAIVYMVNNTTDNDTTTGQFQWDEAQQGIILGMFFYGYVLTQVPGGRLAEVIGNRCIKSVIGISSLRLLVGSG